MVAGAPSDAALPGLAATGLSFREVALARVDLAGGRLINLAFADVELDTCNLATIDARSGSMRRVIALGCRMTGLLWTEGALRDVTLSDCAIDLASFAATTIEHVVFERCILRQTDFQDADLRLVSFVDCDLTDADVSGRAPRPLRAARLHPRRPARGGEPAWRGDAVGGRRRRGGHLRRRGGRAGARRRTTEDSRAASPSSARAITSRWISLVPS